jgi:hypothetical protein
MPYEPKGSGFAHFEHSAAVQFKQMICSDPVEAPTPTPRR